MKTFYLKHQMYNAFLKVTRLAASGYRFCNFFFCSNYGRERFYGFSQPESANPKFHFLQISLIYILNGSNLTLSRDQFLRRFRRKLLKPFKALANLPKQMNIFKQLKMRGKTHQNQQLKNFISRKFR